MQVVWNAVRKGVFCVRMNMKSVFPTCEEEKNV